MFLVVKECARKNSAIIKRVCVISYYSCLISEKKFGSGKERDKEILFFHCNNNAHI